MRRALAKALLLLLVACAPSGPGRSAFKSSAIVLDGVESPLNSPRVVDKQLLVRDHPEELVWLTGFHRDRLAGENGQTLPSPLPAQLQARLANLDRHRELMDRRKTPETGELFWLGEGVARGQLPPGFGLPMLSGEPIAVTTAVANLDPYRPATPVSVEGGFDFIYERGLSRPMVPLWAATVRALVSRQGKPAVFGVKQPRLLEHGEGCPVLPAGSDQVVRDGLGQNFSADWLQPGEESITRTLVTHQLELPYDTTLHYATASLLPGAERIELRDRSEQRALVTLAVAARNPDGTLAEVPVFSSAQGLPMDCDHEFEVLLTYRGRKGAPAMGAMSLYMRDHEFAVAEVGH